MSKRKHENKDEHKRGRVTRSQDTEWTDEAILARLDDWPVNDIYDKLMHIVNGPHYRGQWIRKAVLETLAYQGKTLTESYPNTICIRSLLTQPIGVQQRSSDVLQQFQSFYHRCFSDDVYAMQVEVHSPYSHTVTIARFFIRLVPPYSRFDKDGHCILLFHAHSKMIGTRPYERPVPDSDSRRYMNHELGHTRWAYSRSVSDDDEVIPCDWSFPMQLNQWGDLTIPNIRVPQGGDLTLECRQQVRDTRLEMDGDRYEFKLDCGATMKSWNWKVAAHGTCSMQTVNVRHLARRKKVTLKDVVLTQDMRTIYYFDNENMIHSSDISGNLFCFRTDFYNWIVPQPHWRRPEAMNFLHYCQDNAFLITTLNEIVASYL